MRYHPPVGAAIVMVTDFGRDDAYAAALVGAALRVDPAARCVEGTHGVAPGDVLAAAYHVKGVARAFPAGTVICAVVDPGVGSARAAIAVEAAGIRCVAPDTGLVSYLWEEAALSGRRCVRLPAPVADVSPTFHGRDVFAPVAARLAAGAGLEEVGEPVASPYLLEAAFATRQGDRLHGRVAVVDRFGNAVTTVRGTDLAGTRVAAVSWTGGATDAVVRTYAEIEDGLAVLMGSAGHLEVAARERPADDLEGPGRGAEVVVSLR